MSIAKKKIDERYHFDSLLSTPVRLELMRLAKKHTGTNVDFCEDTTSGDEKIIKVYTRADTDTTAFYTELERLESVITRPLNEPILADDHPVYQGYVYVVNGSRVVEFLDGLNVTVGRWKAMDIPGVQKVTEVRRCDLAGRRLRLPPEKPKVPSTDLPGRWDSSGKHINQARRKSRNSHKIKKVR
jgi:hypothetical protein